MTSDLSEISCSWFLLCQSGMWLREDYPEPEVFSIVVERELEGVATGEAGVGALIKCATRSLCSSEAARGGLYSDSKTFRTSALLFNIQSGRDSHSHSKYRNFISGLRAIATKWAGTRSVKV